MKQCTKPRCGSMALNLHKQGIETTLCDVCYWQDQAGQKEAELATLRTQLEAVGAGGVSGRLMVPRCLSPDMRRELLNANSLDTAKLYAALLAAAPQPPTAQPEQSTQLKIVIDRAWADYERMGEVCSYEGNSMIYASTLEEIYEASTIAQPVQPAKGDAK